MKIKISKVCLELQYGMVIMRSFPVVWIKSVCGPMGCRGPMTLGLGGRYSLSPTQSTPPQPPLPSPFPPSPFQLVHPLKLNTPIASIPPQPLH